MFVKSVAGPLAGILISGLVLLSTGARATLIGDSVEASLSPWPHGSRVIVTQFTSPQTVGGHLEFSGVWAVGPGSPSTIGIALNMHHDGFTVSGFQTSSTLSYFSTTFPQFMISLSDLDWQGPGEIVGLTDVGGTHFPVSWSGVTSTTAFVEFRGLQVGAWRRFEFVVEETQIPEPPAVIIATACFAGLFLARRRAAHCHRPVRRQQDKADENGGPN